MTNDRFKFRVWDDKRKLYTLPGDLSIDADGELWENCTQLDNSDNHLVIEQCTGVKDKNGNLIYEGDVLRATCTDGTHIDYPIGWWDGAFHMYHINKEMIAETGTIEFCLKGLVSVKNCCYREIIGNIHEMEVASE